MTNLRQFHSKTPGESILFNPTDHHRDQDGNARIDAETREALLAIKRVSPVLPLEQETLDEAETVFESGVLVSPHYLLGDKDQLHPDIARYFVSNDAFAAELWERLEDVGAFKFLEGVNNRRHSESILLRAVAIFGMSAIGHGAFDDVNLDFIHAVVNWFRLPDNSRWRKFPSQPVHEQCFRNIVLGLAEIFGDQTLVEKASNHREYVGRISSWKVFSASDAPVAVELNRLLEDFLDTSLTSPKNSKTTLMHVADWLQSKHPGKTFSEVCLMPDQKRGFIDYLEFECGKQGKALLDLANVSKRITDHFISQLELEQPGEVFYPFVSTSEQIRAKNAPVKAKPTSTRSRPFPERLHAIAKFILDEAERGWAGRSGLFNVKIDGEWQYCPVIPTLLRNALDIPLRIVQWRRLDSGEGDMRRYNADTERWESNDGPLRGYWADSEGAPREGYPEKGFAHEFTDGPRTVTGFFINTNKTSSPYTIPWQHKQVHKRLWDLRQWQEKFNPITDALRPEQYLDDTLQISKTTQLRLPDILPVHRLFPTTARPWAGRIPTPAEMDHAWQALNAEVQRVWNEDNPNNPIEIVWFDPRTKQPWKAKYNLHGIRVKGLTDLYRSGMKPELISKIIAGHATVTMTIYYFELLSEEIDQKLSEAALKSQAAAALETMDDFAKSSFDDARKRVVAMQPATVEAAHQDRDRFLFSDVGIGFCPFACDPRRCNDGGPIARSSETKHNTAKHVYNPVPGGPRNCIMCRHFVTSPAWLVPLELFGSKLCEERRHLAEREQEFAAQVDKAVAAWRSKTLDEKRYRQLYDELEKKLGEVRDKQELVENSIFNVEVLLRACAQLLTENADTSGRLPMLANSSESIVQYVETTEFEHSLLQTFASRIHPVLEDGRVEANRNRYLEMMLFDSGIKPPGLMFDVTPEMRKTAMDRFGELLIRHASRVERKALSEGHQSLRDLRAWDQIDKLFSAALNNEIVLPSEPNRDLPILELLK